MLDMWRIE